jgi:hypothetical protein
VARLVSSALRALLEHLIDYAGLFQPAFLPVETASLNYERYLHGEHSWIIGRFVVGEAQVDDIPTEKPWRLAILANADHSRADVIEAKQVLSCSKPVYCEVPLDQFDDVKSAGSFGKIRMGAVTANGIPSVEEVAEHISICARLRLPFKATAGLHHPIRSLQALTYHHDAPRAAMHGFVNVFLAAGFAFQGFGEHQIEHILAEKDPAAFRFDDEAHWRDLALTTGEIAAMRKHFAHSFGSCSFEEPVQELEALGWL